MNEATKDINNLNSFTEQQKKDLDAFFYVMSKMNCSPVVCTLKDYINEKTNNNNSTNSNDSL